MEPDLNELLTDAPALASLVLGTGAATVVAAAVSVRVALLGRSGPKARIAQRLSWASPALFAVFAVCLVALVESERAVLIELIGHAAGEGRAGRATRLATSLSVQINGLWWGALVASLAAPAAAFGAALPWALASEAKATRSAALAVAGAVALPLVITAALATRYGHQVVDTFGAVARADVTQKAALLDEGLRYAAEPFGLGAVALLVAGAIGGVMAAALAARAARHGAVVGTGPLVASALVLLAGVACFVGTRALAHDAARPLEIGPSGGLARPPEGPTLRLGSCATPSIAPVARITSATEATLDRRSMDLARFAQDLDTMRRNWSVLHPGLAFPERVAVTADGSLPATELAPWLRVACDAGYTQVDVLWARTRRLSTRSLGDLERRDACAVRFVLDRGGRPISSYRSWQDVARAASAEERLRIAPGADCGRGGRSP